MILVARSAGRLSGGSRWRLPGNIGEIEEFGHVHLRRIPLRQTGQVKTSFDQLHPGSVVSHGVRHKMLLAEG